LTSPFYIIFAAWNPLAGNESVMIISAGFGDIETFNLSFE